MFKGLVPIPKGSTWFYLDESFSQDITDELRKEIGPEHLLYQLIDSLLVIAKSGANDDVVVANKDDIEQLFWVHLTWSGKPDQYPGKYPSFGRIPNADLLAFFLQEARERADGLGPGPQSRQTQMIDVIAGALSELEAADEIVICSPTPDAIARIIYDRIEAKGLSGGADIRNEEV